MTASLCPLRLRKDSLLTQRLLEKKQLLKAGDAAHKKYKTALVIEGGIMLGVYGGGVVIGLEELGMTDLFDYVIGVSAGSAIGAYFLAKQAAMGTSIYYEDLANKKFINFLRLNNMLDLDYLEDVFRDSKPLDIEKVRHARSELLISVTNMRTGKGRMISSREKDIDLVTALKASCFVPALYRGKVIIDGDQYCDGAIGVPDAVTYAVKDLHCTDIIVITNRQCDCKQESSVPPLVERLLIHTLLRGDGAGFKSAFLSREKKYRHDMDLLWQGESVEKVHFGLICRDKMPITGLSTNANTLEQVARDATDQVRDVFL